MELFSLYYTVTSSIDLATSMMGSPQPASALFLYGLFGVVIWAALFTLQGIGLSTMAKNRGMEKTWRAFVPFVNIYLLGKLAGDCQFFGKRIKRIGLYTMIAQIVVSVLMALALASEMHLYITYGEPSGLNEQQFPVWTGLTGISQVAYGYYIAANSFMSIFSIAYEILLFITMTGFCQKYFPKNYMLLAVLSLFIPEAHFIIIFALRKRRPIDYQAYMRARYEAHMRQQYGQYGAGQQGNPYGANPYARPNPAQNNAPTQTPADDPFEEFSSAPNTASNENNTQQASGHESDDFFN